MPLSQCGAGHAYKSPRRNASWALLCTGPYRLNGGEVPDRKFTKVSAPGDQGNARLVERPVNPPPLPHRRDHHRRWPIRRPLRTRDESKGQSPADPARTTHHNDLGTKSCWHQSDCRTSADRVAPSAGTTRANPSVITAPEVTATLRYVVRGLISLWFALRGPKFKQTDRLCRHQWD
jgi:hypothetical protein